MKQIGVGLVGFGLAGRVLHGPLLRATEGFALRAVVTSQRSAVADWDPDLAIEPDVPALLASDDVDLVVLGVPNDLHALYAREALAAGKHVVLEKPFVVEPADGEALIELARQHRRVLTVFHNRRWDGDFLTVSDLIAQGVLGDIVHFESHFDRVRAQPDGRWKEQDRPGGGNLYDLGSHLLDQALQLFGQPDAVNGDVAVQRQGARNTDYFHLVLRYGVRRVILHGGTLVAAPTPRFIVHGTQGSFVKYGLDAQEGMLGQGLDPHSGGWGEEPESAYGRIYLPDANQQVVATQRGRYEVFYEQLRAAINDGAAPPVAAEDALAVVRIIAAVEGGGADG